MERSTVNRRHLIGKSEVAEDAPMHHVKGEQAHCE